MFTWIVCAYKMAEPHDEGEIPDLGDLAGDLPMEYEGFEPISPGKLSHLFGRYRI